MQYSFGILCYNQERYILELLESIRYQIENYGKNIEFFLFLSDDCSSDRTVELSRKWLQQYGHLFSSYNVMVSERNCGTVLSYRKLLNQIKTEFFKIIAGDDLFSVEDLFEDLGDNCLGTAKAHMPLLLCNNKVQLDSSLLYHNILMENKKRDNAYDIERLKLGGYVSTPGFFPTRSLIDESCIDFISQFTVFEDDPTWYMILKNNTSLVFDFDAKIKVLYRIHDGAVSNASKISEVWYRDYVNLKRFFIKETKSIYKRFVILLQIIEMEHSYKTRRKHKVSMLKVYYRIVNLITRNKANKYLTEHEKEAILVKIRENQRYYDMIVNRVNDFLKQTDVAMI